MNGAPEQHDANPPSAPRKSAGLTKMVVVAIGAFALTFALVPLYRIACEKVFGDSPNPPHRSAQTSHEPADPQSR